MGLEAVREGFFFPHDDDSIVHPKFFRRIEEEIRKNPDKKGFIYGQQRWDGVGNRVLGNGSTELWPDPNNIRVGAVDSAMALIHRELAGTARYDLTKGAVNDGEFIERVYAQNASRFLLIPETLCYYNYLRVDNKGLTSQAYRG